MRLHVVTAAAPSIVDEIVIPPDARKPKFMLKYNQINLQQ